MSEVNAAVEVTTPAPAYEVSVGKKAGEFARVYVKTPKGVVIRTKTLKPRKQAEAFAKNTAARLARGEKLSQAVWERF